VLNFEYIWIFILLPLPLLIRWLLPAHQETLQAVRAPFFNELAELTGQEPGTGAVVQKQPLFWQIFVIMLWLLIVTALARPQWIEAPIVKTVPSRDLLLAVDLSGSMETEDFTDDQGKKTDRLTAVKQVLDDFLARRKGDRVGLIFFGSAVFIQSPFTQDLDTCRQLLDEAQVRMAGPKTMLGDAIGLAITIFERSDMKTKVLIILTDGNDTGSKVPPEKAAEIAHDRKITIYTVAVGDPQAAGEEKLDTETLKAVASKTGGEYFQAGDREKLADIYKHLDELGTHKIETVSHRPKRDLFHWPLGAALLLSLAYHLVMGVKTGIKKRELNNQLT